MLKKIRDLLRSCYASEVWNVMMGWAYSLDEKNMYIYIVLLRKSLGILEFGRTKNRRITSKWMRGKKDVSEKWMELAQNRFQWY